MNAVIHHPGRALAVGLTIAIALLALLPGSWAEAQTGTGGAPPPTVTVVPTTVPLTPGSTTTTTVGLNPGTGSSITLPPGSIPAGVTQLSVTTLASPADADRQPTARWELRRRRVHHRPRQRDAARRAGHDLVRTDARADRRA